MPIGQLYRSKKSDLPVVIQTLLEPGVMSLQLEYLMSFYQLLWHPNTTPNALIDQVHSYKGIILPVCTHKVFFTTLLQQKMYDMFYIRATELLEKVKPYDFGVELQTLIIDAFPLLQ